LATKIFISYARANRPAVERIQADFEGCGHAPFLDNELSGGQTWWDELLRQIEECEVFVPVLSDAYMTSTACEREAAYAIALGKPILPVAIEEVSPGLFAHRIAEAQWVTYDPDDRASLLSLVRGIDNVQPAPSLPDPMPERPGVPISYLTDLRGQIQIPGELTRADQLRLLAELKSRLDGDEADNARRLLKMLRQRPDVSYQAATEIDQILRSEPPPPTPPTPPEPTPTPPPAIPTVPKPPNYLPWTILTTVLCCLPLGAAGIYFAVQVDKKYFAGDMAGAQEASRRARMWAIVTAVVGAVGIALWLLFTIASQSSTGY